MQWNIKISEATACRGISGRRIRQLCKSGVVKGGMKGRFWLVPENTQIALQPKAEKHSQLLPLLVGISGYVEAVTKYYYLKLPTWIVWAEPWKCYIRFDRHNCCHVVFYCLWRWGCSFLKECRHTMRDNTKLPGTLLLVNLLWIGLNIGTVNFKLWKESEKPWQISLNVFCPYV